MDYEFSPPGMEHHVFPPDFDGTGLCIGIVWSRFNEDIVQVELEACLKELKALNVSPQGIVAISVPGALELGVALARMEEAFPEIHALIALGAVIRGETYHFEIVSKEMSAAITHVSLEMGTPVINGVLTTDTEAHAKQRAKEKGRACARAAVEMGNLALRLDHCATYNAEEDMLEDDDDIDGDNIVHIDDKNNDKRH